MSKNSVGKSSKSATLHAVHMMGNNFVDLNDIYSQYAHILRTEYGSSKEENSVIDRFSKEVKRKYSIDCYFEPVNSIHS